MKLSTALLAALLCASSLPPVAYAGAKSGVDGTLDVSCVTGCSAGSGTFNNNGAAVAPSGTNGQTAAFNYAFDGANWQYVKIDGSHNMDINCVVGCAGGKFSNAADGVATSGANGQTGAFNYIFNGSTWDRVRGTGGAMNIAGSVTVTSLPGSPMQATGGTVGLVAGTAVVGGIKLIDTGGTNAAAISAGGAVKVDGSAVTQPVSGAVTVSGTVAASNFPATVDTNSGAAGPSTLRVVQSTTPAVQCGSSLAINQTASTDVLTTTAKANICSIVLISATAQNVSVVEGTGSVCATGIAALVGGTTASLALAANQGFSSVAGVPWLKSKTTADHICILQSGVGNVSGVITYTDAS